MKNLASFDTPIEAELLVSRLRAEGVAGTVRDDQVVSMNAFAEHTFGRVNVDVADEDYERARRVFAAYADGPAG